ncbi:MAG: ABC transporter permease subunit [Xenococcaceae cyanobacterium MO_188.B19]|nr:ABC transporter permease subunit [Xenococcaceae cyanobacterium MO_188.B19]
MIITNAIAIFKKEFKSYFYSPLAYIVSGVFWLISGILLIEILLGEQGIIQQVSLSEQLGVPTAPIDVTYIFINSFFGVIGTLCLFILPILSMGLYSEERKRGTMELLATSPISNWVVALGKLLGVIAFFSVMIMPLVFYEIIIFNASDPPISLIVPLLAHLGLILLASAILSLGMFISSLTDSTIVSAILTFALIIFLWIVDLLGNNIDNIFGTILQKISLLEGYNNLVQGVLDTRDLVLLFTYIFMGLFFTAQSIETLRYTKQ